MTYTPPQGNLISINFDGVDYIAPQGNLVALDFSIAPVVDDNKQYLSPNPIDSLTVGRPILAISQFLNPLGFDELNIGTAYAWRLNQHINTSGINSNIFGLGKIENLSKELKPTGTQSKAAFGTTKIYNLTTIVKPIAWQSLNIGTGASIVNKNKILSPHSWVSSSDGKPLVYNLTQYQRLNGFNTSRYGAPYLMGGVKYINLNNRSISAAQYGLATIVNTKADQYAILTNKGIGPLTIPKPNVSPRILYPTGILAWRFGTPLIQRNPSPKGFTTDLYGTAWVSHSPRYLEPNYIDAFNSGYPKVFDPTQKIGVTGVNTVIAGGVFGDISIRNTRRIITVSGLYSQSFSDWSIVESSLRNIIHSGFYAQSFGSNAIQNKTPSIAPIGIYSFDGLNSAIGYRIRTIKPSGWYQPKLGNHRLTKTPELKPSGFNQSAFGSTWISNKTRSIYAGLGRESLAIGGLKVWHYSRRIRTSGLEFSKYGAASIDHGRRTILAKGLVHAAYGNNSWVSYAVRLLSPSSIDYPNISNHRVGGTQGISVFGYVSTLFGSRIIPESQSIYPKGFINTFGISAIDLWKKYIKPNSFLTTGQEGGHRFGTHKFWNLRQYIEVYYDVDNGLTPPKWTGWTTVVNKNRVIGAIGTNVAKVVEPSVTNNARLISLNGISGTQFSQHMIADRVRYFRLQGIEQPYISIWSNIHNAAFVIAPKSIDSQIFGNPATVNTRRYYPRVGNFESMIFGKPMIADRIRTLSFEHRYTIAPIYIPIHRVDLYTRYVDSTSNDFATYGLPALSIHKKIITPRWTLKHYFGDVDLYNVTPEVKTRGRNAEEFGQAAIRTQWRNVDAFGDNAQLFGKPTIADRNRKLNVNSFVAGAIGALRVRGTASPPLSTQYIFLNNVENRGENSEDDTSVIRDGQGITIPFDQVPGPRLRTNVIRPQGFDDKLFGTADVYSNGILIENGIKLDKELGTPMVQLVRRTISINEGIDNKIVMGTPRLSPHTIYAVLEATEQAKRNHPIANLHAVNSDSGYRKPGEVFGRARVWIHNPYLNVQGIWPRNGYGTPRVQLKRRYLEVKGIQAYRFGWHNIGDGTQKIKSQPNNLFTVFGKPGIALAKEKNVQLRITGINASLYGRPVVEFFHRTIKPSGYNALAMGSSRGGSLYMPQSLNVGPRRPTIPVGTLMEKFGTTYIGLKVRDIQVQGFIATVIGYDPTQFKERMRVERGQGGAVIPAQTIKPVGFDAAELGVFNIRLGVHYIRPYGNADHYRKGAF